MVKVFGKVVDKQKTRSGKYENILESNYTTTVSYPKYNDRCDRENSKITSTETSAATSFCRLKFEPDS